MSNVISRESAHAGVAMSCPGPIPSRLGITASREQLTGSSLQQDSRKPNETAITFARQNA